MLDAQRAQALVVLDHLAKGDDNLVAGHARPRATAAGRRRAPMRRVAGWLSPARARERGRHESPSRLSGADSAAARWSHIRESEPHHDRDETPQQRPARRRPASGYVARGHAGPGAPARRFRRPGESCRSPPRAPDLRAPQILAVHARATGRTLPLSSPRVRPRSLPAPPAAGRSTARAHARPAPTAAQHRSARHWRQALRQSPRSAPPVPLADSSSTPPGRRDPDRTGNRGYADRDRPRSRSLLYQ